MRRPRPYPDPRREAGLDPPWPLKVVLRKHVLLPGYALPEDNLLHVYLKACQQHSVTANTIVVAQLLRRARMLQPLPYQRVDGLTTREQLLERLLQHLDVAGTGSLPVGLVQYVLAVLNPLRGRPVAPRPSTDGGDSLTETQSLHHTNPGFHLERDAKQLPIEDLRAEVDQLEFTDYSRRVDAPEFLAAAGRASAGLSDGEVRQAVLELLCYDYGLEALEPAHMFSLVFRRMDVSDEGFVTADELRAVLSRIVPSVPPADLVPQHPALALPPRAKVTYQQFVDVLVSALASVQPALRHQDLETAVRDVLEFPGRPGFVHELSTSLVGDTGLVPLVEALRQDVGFTELRLRQSGIGEDGCRLLCDWLGAHPHMTSLDLSHNPIGSPGGAAMAELLRRNTRVTQLKYEGTHLLRPWSRTHHDHLGPAVCEGGRDIAEALRDNVASARGGRDQAVALLRRSPELIRAMLVGLGDKKGKVPLSILRSALHDLAAEHEWSLEAGVLDDILQTERLVGAGSHALMDSSGELCVGYGELMRFIRSESPVLRVAIAIRHHLPEVKRSFFQLATQRDDDVTGEEAAAAAVGEGGVQEERPPSSSRPPGSSYGEDQEAPAGGSAPPSRTATPSYGAERPEAATATIIEDDFLVPGGLDGEQPAGSTTPHGGEPDAGRVSLPTPEAEEGAASASPPPPSERPAVTTDLHLLRERLLHLAEQPGSGWEVSLTDLRNVLQPDLFAVDYATGVPSRPPLLSPPGSLSGTPPSPAEEEPVTPCPLTWPQFINTVFALYNRFA